MKYWKRLPAEFFLLILPSALGLTVSLYLGGEFFFENFFKTSQFLKEGLVTGLFILSSVFFIILVYIFIRSIIFLAQDFSNKNEGQGRQTEILKLIGSSVSFVAIVWFTFLSFLLLFYYFTYNSSLLSVTKYSQLFMNWDFSLFSVYPGFWLNSLWSGSFFEELVVSVYDLFIPVLAVVFAVFLIFSKDIFRRFLLSILFVIIVSQPFWYFFPSVSPSWIYLKNSYNLSVVDRQLVSPIPDYKLSSFLEKKIDDFEDFWVGEERDQLAVTTNPSMHVAWGVIVAYYLTMLWWPLALLLIPLAVLNSLGTIYNFEHYGVDIISGFLFAVFVITLVDCLCRREKRLNINTDWIYYFVISIQKDLRAISSFLSRRI